jgi:hypothetical protein
VISTHDDHILGGAQRVIYLEGGRLQATPASALLEGAA